MVEYNIRKASNLFDNSTNINKNKSSKYTPNKKYSSKVRFNDNK